MSHRGLKWCQWCQINVRPQLAVQEGGWHCPFCRNKLPPPFSIVADVGGESDD